MLQRLLSRLTYANVTATIALFMALATGGAYAAQQITSADIVDGEVKSVDIGDKEVRFPDINSAAVRSRHLATDAVLTQHIAPDAVGKEDIGPNAITESKIDATAVTESKIGDTAVTPPKIGTMPAARVQKTSFQTVPHNAGTVLTFQSEAFDTAGLHDNVTDNSRLRAPIDGLYQVSVGIHWGEGSEGPGGARFLGLIAFDVGGAVFPVAGSDIPAPGILARQSTSALVRLPAGGSVQGVVRQTSGRSVTVGCCPGSSVAADTFLAMHWVGPSQ
jgi:hypothetical protein